MLIYHISHFMHWPCGECSGLLWVFCPWVLEDINSNDGNNIFGFSIHFLYQGHQVTSTVCLWCLLFMCHQVTSTLCLWCLRFMGYQVTSTVCLWCLVSMGQQVISTVCLWCLLFMVCSEKLLEILSASFFNPTYLDVFTLTYLIIYGFHTLS